MRHTFTFTPTIAKGWVAVETGGPANRPTTIVISEVELKGWLFRALRDEVSVENAQVLTVPGRTVRITVEIEEAPRG
jgi:hypothetical protein